MNTHKENSLNLTLLVQKLTKGNTFAQYDSIFNKANLKNYQANSSISAIIDLTLCNEKNGTVVFTENHKDGYIAVGFKGKSSKPEFNIRFTSEANRSKHIEKFIAQDKLRQAQKDEEKAKRNAFVPSCVVGDVFAGTWGFEQTNVSFYQVIAIKNKSVVLRQLEMDKHYNGEMSMTGKAYPLINQFSSNEIKKVVQVGDQIKISDYLTVKLIKPLKSVGKTPVYEGISFSEYA